MHRIYILCLEAEMVEKLVGASRLNKFVQSGQVLLLTLSVGMISGEMHLRIYSELNTLLLDISANTSAKVRVACPQKFLNRLSANSELSGAAWLEYRVPQCAKVPRAYQVYTAMEDWDYISCDEWMNYLRLESLGTTRKDLYLFRYAQLRVWSEGLKSVVDALQFPLSKVGLWQLQSIFLASDLY